jgi:formylmethanofuran dehydrogenase subunit E
MAQISTYSFEEYLRLVESFHGATAPGVVIGGFMVDLAMSRIPAGTVFDAICETTACLPDAIQLLTRCTVGNGWLKVFNLGRFALSLYDKYEGKGIRVFIDPPRLEPWPEIKAWFFKLKPKSEQDEELLVSQIERAGHSICGLQPVRIKTQYLNKKSRGKITTCTVCHEAYPAKDGVICLACQGETPYTASFPSHENRHVQRCPIIRAAPVV